MLSRRASRPPPCAGLVDDTAGTTRVETGWITKVSPYTALYFYGMRPFGLIWFFMWRRVAWTISCGVTVGVLVAALIEILRYAGGGAGEVVGAPGLGALIGGFLGVLPGVLKAWGRARVNTASPVPHARE